MIFQRGVLLKSLSSIISISYGELTAVQFPIRSIIERERGLPAAQKALAAIEQLPIEWLPATRERILQAAHIKASARLSYADAFAAAAASEFKGSVLTGDPEFAEAENEIPVTWLPRKYRDSDNVFERKCL